MGRQEAMAAADARVRKANDAIQAFHAALSTRARAKWIGAGGCERCHGSGQVVVWDTGYRYQARQSLNLTALVETPEEKAEVAALYEEREAATAEWVRLDEHYRIGKGKRVTVVGGRKVPLGTEGEIVWIGPDKYARGATRVGVKDATGTVHWTSANNVEVTE